MMIKPEKDLKRELLSIKNPGHYVGGEYGIKIKSGRDFLRIGLCFPDLYEIGMSNLAIRLLYNRLNRLSSVSCERVFVPDLDFEELLKEKEIPLYTLESGIPIRELDLLLISVGYELSATNILTVIERGEIPLLNTERKGKYPLVVAGGPAVTNPEPFGTFLDFVFLGEAEEEIEQIITACAEIKKRGGGREAFFEPFLKHSSFWYKGKTEKTRRSLWKDFSFSEIDDYFFPIPTIPPVQNHGVIEIMRGCPNGCRFCHASYFYRPYRERSVDYLIKMVDSLIFRAGYREISLTSLSSGDYSLIESLSMKVNDLYKDLGISISLPSLKIDSFTLDLLGKLSVVRKGSLTFAVETSQLDWQRKVNKIVSSDKIIEILREAKGKGWRNVKFYFMQGLPLGIDKPEEEIQGIVDLLMEIQQSTGLKINVNLGTFIPKPHTPFQWARMLTPQESKAGIDKLFQNLPRKYFKVGYHNAYTSFLEGMISRGDSRVGEIILSAYNRGARLDAWDEKINYNAWEETIKEASWSVEEETCRAKERDEVLPWTGIELSATPKYLWKEWERAKENLLTTQCLENCIHNCGGCSKERIIKAEESLSRMEHESVEEIKPYNVNKQEEKRILFSYKKTGKAVFVSHISVMTLFEMGLLRAGLFTKYSEGFNPKPKLEFASPLSLGLESQEEVAAVYLYNYSTEEDFLRRINKALPEGFHVTKAMVIENPEKRRISLMSMYWGSMWRLRDSRGQEKLREKILILPKELVRESICPTGEESDNFVDLTLKNLGKKEFNIASVAITLAGLKEYWKVLDIERRATLAGKDVEKIGIDYFTFYSV